MRIPNKSRALGKHQIESQTLRSKQQHHESTRIRTKTPREHQTYQKHQKNTKIRLKTLGKEAP
jgi:hypothetical protein